ncbi:MAG TPA: hypothetical protein VNA88_02700 [Candidatus Kapabacteria bacterium]|nr:hypothetical protein [Candidatus Kapabacteria bacterium]
MWDVDARQPRLPPVAIDDPRVVAITSTGDTAITGATDGTLSLWNTLTGSLIERHSCDAGVTAIAATDPREVFAGLVSGSLMRLSLQDGTLRRVAGPDVWERPTGPLTSIASTLQESRCLVGTSYGTVLIVDAQSGALAAVREGHVIDVYAIAIIDDGFVSAGRDGQLLRWRPAAVTPESIIELMAPVGASSFSSDGAAVVVNGWNQLTEFASATGRFGVGYAAGSGSELDIEHANASERIATAGSDGFIRVFDPGVATARSAQVDAIAMSVSFSHDDALLAFGGVNVVGWLHTADLTDRTDIDVVGHGYVTSFAPASDRLLIGDMTGMVRLIEVPSALELASLQVHGDQITALVPFGDRGWLSASLDGSVRLITSNPLRDTVVFAGSQPIYALAGHVDGFYFFGGGDSAVYGWMPDHPVNRVLELGGLILSLATSSSERRLAIGMNDALIMARVDGGSGVVEQRDLHDDAVVIRSTRGETTIRHREHACVSIYDMLGRLRMRALPDGDQQHVVRDLERGVYVCVVSERHDTRSALFHVDGP